MYLSWLAIIIIGYVLYWWGYSKGRADGAEEEREVQEAERDLPYDSFASDDEDY